MKGLFSKVMVGIAGATALFGISANNLMALSSDISAKSPLYLEHGKSIGSSVNVFSDHESHWSHESHQSHRSHSSGW